MIVPKFWAEARIKDRVDKSQVTIRRFGWSNLSQTDAEENASRRASEALARLRAGEKLLPRREPKVSYNGADGIPIREEIVSEHGDTVVTRNIYGALCLNTPDVLFADLDFEIPASALLTCGPIILCPALAIVAGVIFQSAQIGFVTLFLVSIVTVLAAVMAGYIAKLRSPGAASRTKRRIERTLRKYADWRVRVYRTPAGFRLLVTHRLFKPDEPEALAFFKALKADPTYVRMCKNQQCFRARVSPKPWRIGISQHIRPRPGIWPINPERMPERRRWIEAYNQAAQKFSSCHYVDTFGTGSTNPKAGAVQKLHDELARATSGLPTA